MIFAKCIGLNDPVGGSRILEPSAIRVVDAKRSGADRRLYEVFGGPDREAGAVQLIEAAPEAIGVCFETGGPAFPFAPYDRIVAPAESAPWDAELLSELARQMALYPAQWGRFRFDAVGLPAAYTYFAQLIAHDLTWTRAQTSRDGVRVDAARLDFGSVWEGARADVLGCTSDGQLDDVARHACGAPRHADTRMDQNLTLSQLCVLLIKFDRVVADRLGDAEAARRCVRRHLQWITLHDLLPRLVDPVVLRDVMASGACPLLEDGAGFVPIEFAAAAFRLGHAMVRTKYPHWRRGGDGAGFEELLNFTHHTRASRFVCVEGAQRLPNEWTAGWDHLLGAAEGYRNSHAAAIDENLAHGMFALPDSLGDCAMQAPTPDPRPGGSFNLAEHTLLRGNQLRIPGAQEISEQVHERLSDADAASLPRRLPAKRIAQTRAQELSDFLLSDAAQPLREATPLWFYLLREADVHASGQRFGPLASRITAETIYRAIKADPDGILNNEFAPEIANDTGRFGLKDLHAMVQTHWTETL